MENTIKQIVMQLFGTLLASGHRFHVDDDVYPTTVTTNNITSQSINVGVDADAMTIADELYDSEEMRSIIKSTLFEIIIALRNET